MLTEDYIIRMINLAIAALLQIVGLKKAGDFQTALMRIDMTFEHLLGLRSGMVKGLDDDRLYYLLTRDGRLDTVRLGLVADLFHQEGDVWAALGRADEARQDYTRALRYNLEVVFNNPEVDLDELKKKIEDLVQKLDLLTLGADTLWPLAGYFEESGAYVRAETALLTLVARPETSAEIRPEVAAFYGRLTRMEREALERGGMTPEQARTGFNRFSK